jgi:hypothetical protein
MFKERRWERHHTMGWRSVVVETHEGWYTAWAQPPGRSRSTPALQDDDLVRCQEAADARIPPHDCRCDPWREISPPRRWPRTQPQRAVLAHVDGDPAVVLDLSYGGVRFETRRDDIPATFAITFGGFNVTVQARAVWSHRAASDLWWWGAEVADVRPTRDAWWPLVDSLSPRR